MPLVAANDVLFESSNLRVWRVRGADEERSVVTFDSYTDDRTLDRPGFGEAFLHSRRISAIHVISRDNDWYQYPEMPEALARIADATAGQVRTITYGTSMGGYAAIRFADRVGARAALGISPQYSIDPKKTPFEVRWKADAKRIRFIPDLDGPISSATQIVVPYDPTGTDRRHVELISAEVAVTPLKVRYAGHSVPAFLSEAELLEPLLIDLLHDQLDINATECSIRKRKKSLSVYFAELSARQIKRGSHLAVPLARRAVEINHTSDIACRALAEALASVGDAEGAILAYEDLLRRGRHLQYLSAFSNLLAEVGDSQRALIIAREAQALAPNLASTRYWLATLLEREGRLEDALAEVTAAVEFDSSNPLYRKTRQILAGRVAAMRAPTVLTRLGKWFPVRS